MIFELSGRKDKSLGAQERLDSWNERSLLSQYIVEDVAVDISEAHVS